MQTFEEILKEHSTHVAPDRESILANLDILLGETPYANEEDVVNKGRRQLVKEYYRTKFGERYTLLSKALFRLTRTIQVPKKAQKEAGNKLPFKGTIDSIKEINLPLVICTELGEAEWSQMYRLDTVVKGSFGYQTEGSTQITISAKAPLIPYQAKQAAMEAIAFCYEVCASARRNPTIQKHLGMIGKMAIPHETDVIVNPVLHVAWKPTLDDFKFAVGVPDVPDPDPALILWAQGEPYLVTTWDVPNEEPIKYLLREYSIGKVNPRGETHANI